MLGLPVRVPHQYRESGSRKFKSNSMCITEIAAVAVAVAVAVARGRDVEARTAAMVLVTISRLLMRYAAFKVLVVDNNIVLSSFLFFTVAISLL